MASVNTRQNLGRGCPYCSKRSKIPCCLLTSLGNPKYTKLHLEWSQLNQKQPRDFYPKSRLSVWWSCGRHTWKTRISSRTTKGNNCPKCARSKMEEKMASVLQSISLTPTVERRILEFKKQRLPGSQEEGKKACLEADFLVVILLDAKTLRKFVIEMDGQQHFVPVSFGAFGNILQEQYSYNRINIVIEENSHIVRSLTYPCCILHMMYVRVITKHW